MPDDLPPHSVRVSKRARRVRLVVTPRDGLVVVVPARFPPREVPDVLRSHSVWIERATARMAEKRAHIEALQSAPLPTRVDLPGIAVSWAIALRPGPGGRVRGVARGGELVLSGAVENKAACHEAMRRAVARAARERLPLALGGVEAETGWRAERVSVRRQRSRWGSCSARGTISLNSSLCFLPSRLVRFVLIHELAHTQRLDHSPAFWALVARHEAEWRSCRRELRDAWRHVPAWAEP